MDEVSDREWTKSESVKTNGGLIYGRTFHERPFHRTIHRRLIPLRHRRRSAGRPVITVSDPHRQPSAQSFSLSLSLIAQSCTRPFAQLVIALDNESKWKHHSFCVFSNLITVIGWPIGAPANVNPIITIAAIIAAIIIAVVVALAVLPHSSPLLGFWDVHSGDRRDFLPLPCHRLCQSSPLLSSSSSPSSSA